MDPQRRHMAHLLGGVLLWHRPVGISWIAQHAVPPGREEPLGRGSSLWAAQSLRTASECCRGQGKVEVAKEIWDEVQGHSHQQNLQLVFISSLKPSERRPQLKQKVIHFSPERETSHKYRRTGQRCFSLAFPIRDFPIS